MKVFITVTNNKDNFPIWKRVLFGLQGDCTNLQTLQSELEVVKQNVNRAVNQEGFALKDVSIKIELT